MARKSKKEAGSEFLEGILKHLSKEDADGVRAKLAANEAALEFAGDGALRQEEFSRVMDEGQKAIAAKQAETDAYRAQLEEFDSRNQDWYKTNVGQLANGTAALQKLEQLKTKGIDIDFKPPVEGAAPPISTPMDLSDVVRKPDLINAVQQAYGLSLTQGIQYINSLNRLSSQHYTMFKEPLDTVALDKHCRDTRAPSLDAGYATFMKDKLDAHADAQKKAHDDAIRKEARAAFAQELSATGMMPYIPGTEEAGANASLLALKQGNGTSGEKSLQTAIDEFNKGRWAQVGG